MKLILVLGDDNDLMLAHADSIQADNRAAILYPWPEMDVASRAPMPEKLHGDKADGLIKAASLHGQLWIVPTHSRVVEHRIRRRIAEGLLRGEDVEIHYVVADHDPQVNPMDDRGANTLSSALEDVAMVEARAVLAARRLRQVK